MRGRPRLPAIAAASLLLAGAPPRAAEGPAPAGVRVEPLAPQVWLHRTDSALGEANGLIVAAGGQLYLVDTGWTVAQTRTLLDWARRELGRPFDRAVITHAHPDRLGGLAVLLEAGIPAEAIDLTVERSGETALRTLAGRGLQLADGLELYYPGPGHSPDNVVIWLERERLLFGGCLVKALEATSMGHIADADLPGWPAAVERVERRYPQARLVVPGHGAPGTTELLARTRRLVEAALTEQVLEQEARRRRAMIAADEPVLETLLAAELSYTHSTGEVETRDGLLGALRSGRYRYDSIVAPQPRVMLEGGTAVLAGPVDMQIETGGRRIEARSRYTAVYVHRDGAWRLLAYQATPRPPD